MKRVWGFQMFCFGSSLEEDFWNLSSKVELCIWNKKKSIFCFPFIHQTNNLLFLLLQISASFCLLCHFFSQQHPLVVTVLQAMHFCRSRRVHWSDRSAHGGRLKVCSPPLWFDSCVSMCFRCVWADVKPTCLLWVNVTASVDEFLPEGAELKSPFILVTWL